MRRALAAIAVGAGLTGCSAVTVMNEPLPPTSIAQNSPTISTGGYRRIALQPNQTSPDVLAVLAFSGGGKRSAAFSYGVLQGLRDYRVSINGREQSLLDKVSGIASVSGGSFTSAYYGLHRDRIFSGDYERDFLKRDIESYIWGTYVLPWNWGWMFDPNYGTNDRMALIYDDLMFHGATYADLQGRGTPLVQVNATDISYGSVFPFNQDQFDLICSDLSRFPLARAVAASNGFPGLFTPITLEDYAEQCRPREPAWVARAEKGDPETRKRYLAKVARLYLDPEKTKYVHLMDGGISDNLAMRGMLNLLLQLGDDPEAMRFYGALRVRRILMISVDGQGAPDSSWAKSRSISAIGKIFSAVSGSQIDAYNFETLLLARDVLRSTVETIKKLRCEEKIPVDSYPCDDVEGYFVRVSLSDVADPAVREKLQQIPTGLTIPDEDVDTLARVGASLIRDSKELSAFRRSLRPPQPAVAKRKVGS